MVWRKMMCCVAALLIAGMLVQPASAASYTAYDGTISSTYTTLFRDIVGQVGVLDNYVFFRSGQYEYILVAGDLTYEQDIFTAETATEYKIITNNQYTSQYIYSVTEITDFNFAPGTTLIYSNLGSFPDLVDRGEFYSFATLVLALIALCMFLIRSIFSFTWRRRS